MTSDPFQALGSTLTESECRLLIQAFGEGQSTNQAIKALHPSRRDDVRRHLERGGLGRENPATRGILAAIAAAKSVQRPITPVWTMPGAAATSGRLTSEVQRLVDQARETVVCATYNFLPTSQLWTSLKSAVARDVAVTVYVDAEVGNAERLAAHLSRGNVFRSATPPGAVRPFVSHAKFIVVDHTIVLLSSANFSVPAANSNIEFGLLVEDSVLASLIETQMRAQQGVLYNRV